MSNQLTLNATHLAYLKDLAGHTYDTLEPALRRRFGLTQLVAHVIEPQTPEEVKFDIFSRVNTSGEPTSPAGDTALHEQSSVTCLLKALVKSDSFDNATAFAFWTRALGGGRYVPVEGWLTESWRFGSAHFAAPRLKILDERPAWTASSLTSPVASTGISLMCK